MKHSISILISTLLLSTTTTLAQQVENRWLRPEGGNLDDPGNWSLQEIPGPFDTAVFEVGGSQPYTVLGTTGQVGGIEIGGDDVDARFSSVGQVLFAEFLNIGGRPSNSDFRPGRLRLQLDPTSPAFLSFIEVGKQGFASQFAIAPNSTIGTLFFDLRPSATVRFELDQDSGASTSDPVLLAKKGASLEGTIEIIRQPGALLPPLGTTIDLLFVPSGIQSASIPAIVTAAQPGRRIAPEFIDTDGDGTLDRLIGTIRTAETTNVAVPGQSLEIGSPTFAIEAADLDGDGIDEIVIATEAGKLRIYQPTASGGIAGPFDYVIGSIPVDIASGDYDGDGTIDLAIANFGDDDLSILLNPDADPDALVAAENLAVPAGPASIATVDLGEAEGNLIADAADLFVVSRATGTATGYKSRGGGTFEKVSEVEVGEEPGPSSPIDDENKKDPDPPVGVGGTASGLRGGSPTGILTIVQPDPVDGGLEVVGTVPLSGIPNGVASTDVDGDGSPETLVITTTGNLDLIRGELDFSRSSIPLPAGMIATAITTGQFDDVPGPEILIAMIGENNQDPELLVLRPRPIEGPGDGILIDLINVIPLEDAVSALALGTGGTPTSERPSLSIGALPLQGGDPAVNLLGLQTIETPACSKADFNGDGVVDGGDLGSIIGAWGPCEGCAQDLDQNGVVNSADLGLFLSLWGPCSI